jgi:hypothetical protein
MIVPQPDDHLVRAIADLLDFAYANSYLIDLKFGIIVDVGASRAIRQAEIGASRTMIERTEVCFGIKPEWLAADTAFGSASNLEWLVNEQGIAPHVPVIDKSQRDDGTFSREDFIYTRSSTSIHGRRAKLNGGRGVSGKPRLPEKIDLPALSS